ncbi:MAG: NAD(P)/FAD-dependent oxidoreductase [Dehalococcoidales bacterium]|nr:NAD(P)/FAD-dependent oxidoreductase [Dehalococcoidales bacterium]
MHDVIIIGGGPAGSRVAYQLAGKGDGVVVLEQKARLDEAVCCTGIISRECVDAFGIDQSVIFRWANSARVCAPSGKVLSLERPERQACMVNRSAFNLALAQQAQAQGAEYILNRRVTAIKVGSDGVTVEAAGGEGGTNVLEARVVVIASGFGSNLVKGLGLGKASDFVMGAQAEVATTGIDEVEVYLGQEIAPGFFAWLVPTSPGKALVGLLSRHSPGLYLQKLLAGLLAEGKIASAEVEVSYGGIPLNPLAKTYSDRVMVVGTAAGQVKPTTGGGIYYGLLCADMAASNLHRALQSDVLTARNLADYQKEWKKKLGQELKIGYLARRFYERLSDTQIEGIFDIVKSDGIADTLLKAEDLSFDWHGQVVLRLVGHRALSMAMAAMKLQPSLRGKD